MTLALPVPPPEAFPEHSSAGPILRLGEVIGALSYALDLTEGQPQGHCLRCCVIGMAIGTDLGLDADALSDLYYGILLKDAGCSSNAARLWELYGGDERLTKQDYKTVDSQSLVQLCRFVIEHAGPGESLRERARRILRLTTQGHQLADQLIRARCDRGADIVRRLGFGPAVAAGVRALDEHWNGKGRPEGLAGAAIPLIARIGLLAQVADVFHTVGGAEAACAEVRRRAGSWFDPELAARFLTLARETALWPDLADAGLEARVAALEPLARVILIDEDRLDTITTAFAAVVDAKSSFTFGHSDRVAEYADAIAAELGFSAERRRWLHRASLLHDIGKLGVSNAILDKPGKLDSQEWEVIRRHSALSEQILSRVSIFADLAPIVGAHHEKLDGKGYPRGLTREEIALETRIITVADIFDALTAARPYRGPMPPAEAFAILERDREVAIDGACLDALKAALGP